MRGNIEKIAFVFIFLFLGLLWVIRNLPYCCCACSFCTKMSSEIDNGRAGMLIDGHGPEEHRDISIAEEFNANYLQIYYGNFPIWESYELSIWHSRCKVENSIMEASRPFCFASLG